MHDMESLFELNDVDSVDCDDIKRKLKAIEEKIDRILNRENTEQPEQQANDEEKENDIVISGYLEKQSLHLKQFRQRWMILKTDKRLYSFKTINGQKPTEIIDLSDFYKIMVEKEKSKSASTSATMIKFVIISYNDQLKRTFRGHSREVVNTWMSTIQSQLQYSFTKQAKATQNKNDIIKINIGINQENYSWIDKKFSNSFVVYGKYSHQEKMKDILTQTIKHLNNKYYPIKLEIEAIYPESFTMDDNGSIIDHKKKDIETKGLHMEVKVKYKHKVIEMSITCEHMNKFNSDNPLHCPIYSAMKEKYDYSETNYHHFVECNHFANEYEMKPVCKYGQSCKAYIRCERGEDGDRMDDKCHMKVFRHPPRNRNIKLAQNINSLIVNNNWHENESLYRPSDRDQWKYKFNDKDGYLSALISEVISNGYRSDLCLKCGKDDDCKHNQYEILNIVDEKMKHIRHKAMNSPLRRDHTLSLILYTGCDCNYALCAKQRNGDYETWKWFDYCLYGAIKRLSDKESGCFSVYSGLSGVKLDVKEVKSGYFKTYVSTSWRKEVASTFMEGNHGMMIQIDEKYKNNTNINCCDVSWISKFPDECEILFSRSLQFTQSWFSNNKFSCVVLDEIDGVQTVCLKKANWR